MNKFIVIIVLFGTFISCSKEEVVSKYKSRTILVYMVGDGANKSLESEMLGSINKMKEGLSHMSEIPGHWLIYTHRQGENPKLTELYKDGNSIKEKIIKEYNDRNSVSENRFNDVVTTMKKEFHSNSYGLSIWAHGGSWLPKPTRSISQTNSLSLNTNYSINPNHIQSYIFIDDKSTSLDISELENIIGDGAPFEFILFDACIMASVETLYDLRNNAKYFIASPADVLIEGHPYNKLMPYFWGGENELKKLCNSYYEYYNQKKGDEQSASTALIKASELENLYNITKKILNGKYSKVNDMDKNNFLKYFSNITDPDFFDFGDFIKNVCDNNNLYLEFVEQLDKTVIFKKATDFFFKGSFGDKFPMPKDRYSGLNTHIPLKEWNTTYNKSYINTTWGKGVYGK